MLGFILAAILISGPARTEDQEQLAGDTQSTSTSKQRSPWSFRKVVRPAVPTVQDPAWVHNPIDAYVLAKMGARGLAPSPPADKRTLIRRATSSLVGLPPTPEEVESFLADRSPDAYDRLVDRLLASPAYGERWARTWLDVARYAESDGFKTDGTRPNAWRYRDYVIESLNADKPYDRFIREQIAGDEVDPENAAALIATGFNRHWPDEDNARNLVLRRQEILNDITDTTASVFLGLTLGCARCHDHKYDPISQQDYYRFQAFFAAFQPVDTVAGSIGQQAGYRERVAVWEDVTATIRAEMDSIEQPVLRAMRQDTMEKFVPAVRDALTAEPDQRTPLQRQLASMAEHKLEITTDGMLGRMAKADRERWTKLRDSLKEFEPLKPPGLPIAMALTDIGRQAPKTYLLRRGIYDAPAEEAEPGFPSALGPQVARTDAGLARPAADNDPLGTHHSPLTTTGRRAELAQWIASPDNSLTARVMVNRLWQGHFGRGIVSTASDFGAQGELPTHPELLDWLAAEFVAQDWSLKAIHRLIVTSNTYRQASRIADCRLQIADLGSSKARLDPPQDEISNQQSAISNPQSVDPDNLLLWHVPRQRIEGELIRDAMLAVSGQMTRQSAGPSIYPELPAGISERYGWKPTPELSQRNRRSIYVFVRRNLRYPLFEVFDMPDTNETCGRRNRTTTAPQSLYLLNSELILNLARAFAGRVLSEVGTEDGALITRAYRLALSRDPSRDELGLSADFLRRQAELVRGRPADSSPPALPTPLPEGFDPAAGAALTDLCHALLNANEFIYVD